MPFEKEKMSPLQAEIPQEAGPKQHAVTTPLATQTSEGSF